MRRIICNSSQWSTLKIEQYYLSSILIWRKILLKISRNWIFSSLSFRDQFSCFAKSLYLRSLKHAARKKRRKRKEGRKETERSRSEKCRSAGARRVSLVRRPVKNSDNTSSCVGPHLNVCIHTLWCIALTRGVVKIIQTDPDSFFSFLSGLGHFLAERCARCTHLHFFLPCPLHCPISIGWFRHPRLLDHLSFFPPVLFLLSLSHVAFCCAVSASFSPSHCPVTRCRIRDCDAFSIIFAADHLTTLWWNIDSRHIVIFERWDKREGEIIVLLSLFQITSLFLNYYFRVIWISCLDNSWNENLLD